MNLIGFANDKISKKGKLPKWLKGWNVRIAVRAVLLDDDGKVALMHIGAYDVYKLPGGGVDEEENLEAGFEREILEETGCKVRAIGDIGVFLEKREGWKLFQVSFAYLAKVLEKGELSLTKEEKEEGFSLQWVDSINQAIKLVLGSKSTRDDDKYMKLRDSSILKSAKKILDNK